MARQAVVDAVETNRLNLWTYGPVAGMVRQDERLDSSSTFLAVQYPVANTARRSVGDRLYREEGAVRFVLQFTRDENRALMMQRADELADLFRDQTIGSVRFLQPTSPFIDDNNDEGNFYSLSIVAPYTFDYPG